jgi:PAS domain-containing protein
VLAQQWSAPRPIPLFNRSARHNNCYVGWEPRIDELMQALPIGLFIVAADGRTSMTNPSFRRLTGADDVAGWMAQLDPPQQQAFGRAWAALRQDGGSLEHDVCVGCAPTSNGARRPRPTAPRATSSPT